MNTFADVFVKILLNTKANKKWAPSRPGLTFSTSK